MAPQRPAAPSLVRRSIMKLTRALPSSRDQSPATKAVRPSAPSLNSLAGRWVRVVADPVAAEGQVDREPDDAGEAAAVRAGWLLIDAYERLSSKAARRVFGHEIDAWNAYTADTIVNLKSPEGRVMADVEESRVNRLRYRRTMDFAHPGDRVFDVGFGRGYLAAQLIRGRGVARYHGIDIVDTWVKASHELLAFNGLADADIALQAGDLFDLTKEQIAATGANLVICCEVLEHVDDAELALRVLADALPDGADLLFSVPLHGRLEQVWGHASVFDVARLKQMLDGAGLYAHHVEPLANTWSLVVASRDPGRSERVRQASGRPAVRASVPLVNERRFVDVVAADLTALAGDNATVVAEASGQPGITCHADATGGVRFDVKSFESLRLAFEFIDCESISRVEVIARVGAQHVTRWTWKPTSRRPATGRRRVWFRPGEASDGFVAGPYGDMRDVDSVEVVVHLPAGRSATYGLAAAYLP